MQHMQSVFNMRMEPIQTHEDYPKYARSETKPVRRARHIIDHGAISGNPCSVCVELKQDCYRWEGTFSKCAYCTSKDKKREFCHLPGQESSPPPERMKRRKIMGNIYAPGGDAASTADTMVSGTLVSGTRVAPPAASEAASEATLERVTALENQVSGLEAKVMELLVKLEEVSSCVSTSSTPRQQAAAGASPTISNITFEDLQAQRFSRTLPPVDVETAVHLATREWVEGPKTPELPDASSPVQVAVRERVEEPKRPSTPEHSIEHPEAYKPVNCSCTRESSMKADAIVPEADAEAQANAFSVDDIASRGNVF